MLNEHDELRSLLARIRVRWFGLTLLTTTGRATAAAAIPLAAAAAIIWAAAPAGWTLVAVVAIACAVAAAAAVRVFVRMQRRPDDSRVARFVEESTGASGLTPVACDTLVSAVEVLEAPDRHSGVFADLLIRQAVGLLREIDPAAVIPAPSMRRAAGQAMGGAALLALTLALIGPGLLQAGAMAWVAAFPRSIGIQVLSGNVRVPAGQPLRLSATLTGRGARLLAVVPSLVVSANGEERTVPMTAAGGDFSYSFESVDRSFQYRVVAGSAASDAFAVTAVRPPKVQSIDVSYAYPSFTGLSPREDKDGGDVYAPAGTRVRLQIHADKPLAAGELRLAGGRPVRLATNNESASAELVLARDDAYRVQLADRDGLASIGDVEYFIRVMDDRPPAVHIVRPNGDQGITPLEEVAIEARADDDYGIAQLELVYAVAGRPPKTVPFTRLSGTPVARIGAHLLAAEDLGVQPGDVITYYARARDVARAKPSTEAMSDMFFLEVKPFTEEFVQAQSQAMGGGGQSPQIDALIAAQKEIINATWNLERRAVAGRSPADIKAVGDAQAELKARAERMTGGGRRGGRGFVPQQILPPAPRSPRELGRDPVAEAIAAMGRAVEQLHDTRTAAALPHEMAALQGLLRAQAEVRRRQVMQQSASAGGGGGSNRSDRDLSALFDRELQRQQRTNYETPRPTTETPERQEGDLLDRIRELARRQEELARRQRELAEARLDAEEMKRQLERLSREQQELRQQADALQKQGQGSGGRGSSSGTPESASMQRAAEQMRNAANEMQRQNAGGAAASGEKAAEALRQLEQQMRGSSASARQRTAGEMQLEAQQLADAQRRMASEMSRLEKERSGSGRAADDPARRLAGEKEQLADRVDALERAAREAQRSSPGQEGAKFGEAARQIQGEQIGARMRQSARQLRGQAQGEAGRAGNGKDAKAPATNSSAAEQQLARALNGVANTLGGGNADEARRLTEQLDRTRDIRERLNELERQVRDADAKQAKQGSRGEGAGSGDAQRLREEYARELQRTRESLGRMQAEQRGGGGATPEQHEWSRSAPGNEAFKQDFSRWESLRKDLDLALERYEAGVSARLGKKAADDRLSGGGSERVPDAYRPLVSKYFESLARDKK
jgi:hypothetical protein